MILEERQEELKDYIEINFSDQLKDEHSELEEREIQINARLKKLLTKSKQKTPLFADVKSHAYMLKPNHLIIKPIFAVMILQNKFYTNKELDKIVDDNFNWRSYDHMHKIWKNKRNLIREKDFIDSLFTYDVRNITNR